MQVGVQRPEELLGVQVRRVRADEQRQVLGHLAALDGLDAHLLERVCIETVESGKMTKDLALLVGGATPYLTTEEFLAALDTSLRAAKAAS